MGGCSDVPRHPPLDDSEFRATWHAVQALMAAAVAVWFLAGSPGNQGPTGPFPRPPENGKFSVFGQDDRRAVDPERNRYSAIGRLTITTGPDSKTICTGALVDTRLVVTNAHCVLQASSHEALSFRANYHFGEGSPEAAVVRTWLGTTNPAASRADDWAVLLLDRDLGREFGWLDFAPLVQASPVGERGEKLSMVAYATDFQKGGAAAMVPGCRVDSFVASTSYFRHDCDMNAGSSGAPLLTKKHGQWAIAAINAAHSTPEPESYLEAFSPRQANIAISPERFLPKLRDIRQTLAQESESLPTATRESMAAAPSDNARSMASSSPTQGASETTSL